MTSNEHENDTGWLELTPVGRATSEIARLENTEPVPARRSARAVPAWPTRRRMVVTGAWVPGASKPHEAVVR